MAHPQPAIGGVLAIDAGNSKTDIAVVAGDGRVLSTARGDGFTPHIVGAESAVEGLVPLVAQAAAAAGLQPAPGRPFVQQVSACLANADLAREEQLLQEAIERRHWGLSTAVANDTFAVLRIGTGGEGGVVVVCGAGINCSGMLPDGRVVRFAAVGHISGDWGGGQHLWQEAMWWAARAEDGRGPDTMLRSALPEHFGLSSMAALIEAVHLDDVTPGRCMELTPVLFAAADAGDQVATDIVHRQAEEIVGLAVAAIGRLEVLDQPIDVVLGGGVVTSGHRLLLDRVDELLARDAPLAVASVVTTPPIVGAALLGLDHIGAAVGAEARLRATYPRPVSGLSGYDLAELDATGAADH